MDFNRNRNITEPGDKCMYCVQHKPCYRIKRHSVGVQCQFHMTAYIKRLSQSSTCATSAFNLYSGFYKKTDFATCGNTRSTDILLSIIFWFNSRVIETTISRHTYISTIITIFAELVPDPSEQPLFPAFSWIAIVRRVQEELTCKRPYIRSQLLCL